MWRCEAPLVVHGRQRCLDPHLPPGEPDPMAEIDVLPVEEVVRVEATGGPPQPDADEEAGTAHPGVDAICGNRRRAQAPPQHRTVIEVQVILLGVQPTARAHHARRDELPGILEHVVVQSREVAGVDPGIRIDHQQLGGARGDRDLGTQVAARPESLVALGRDQPPVPPRAELHRGPSLLGSVEVVHDDDDPRELIAEGAQEVRLHQVVRAVVDDDDAQARTRTLRGRHVPVVAHRLRGATSGRRPRSRDCNQRVVGFSTRR